MTLGDRLRAQREQMRLSREKLSQLTGVMTLTIMRIELGRTQPRLVTLRKLAKALDTKVSTLMEGQP